MIQSDTEDRVDCRLLVYDPDEEGADDEGMVDFYVGSFADWRIPWSVDGRSQRHLVSGSS